ncbi:MAG: hypothetical protein V4733_00020 [Verrucomicrobiota bacterium]
MTRTENPDGRETDHEVTRERFGSGAGDWVVSDETKVTRRDHVATESFHEKSLILLAELIRFHSSMTIWRRFHSRLAIAVICFVTPLAEGAFTISYNYDPSVSQDNRVVFDQAKAFWEGIIVGRLNGSDHTLAIDVSTFSEAASGGSVTLGSAGPTTAQSFSFSADSYTVATAGQAEFNTHPDAIGSNPTFDANVIRHEIGHVLGIGTLWGFSQNSDVYTDGSGQFTGANAVAAFNLEYGQSLTHVPVELDGGAGTANGHWNETGPAAPVVASGPNAGKSFDDELMTGNLSGDAYLSNTTVASLRDIGYEVIPEPSAAILAAAAGVILTCRRRRKA